MTTSYAQHVSAKRTPQSEPIPGHTDQVQNSAGGYVFQVDDWKRLDRFLILGNEGGTYYASERKLTKENAACVARCLQLDARRTVDRIVEISDGGRAPKNDPAIFALALCAAESPKTASYAPRDSLARELALVALPRVCRTGTHLFQFVSAINELRGWGRGLRRGVANWYTDKTVPGLAYQLVKYQQREGWSHRDVLRLCHAKTTSETMNAVLHWVVKGWKDVGEEPHPEAALQVIWAFERLKKSPSKSLAIQFIRSYGLTREMIPTALLTDPAVWEALLESMPMTAMIRNLATMTRIGLLAPLSSAVGKVVSGLGDTDRLRKSRLHPVAILAALLTYRSGHGVRGHGQWAPVPQVVDALDAAFYLAFGNVPVTGKRWLLALDVSGSMTMGEIAGVPGLTPRIASAALALVTAAVEQQYHIMGFGTHFVPIPVTPRQRLDDACRTVASLPMGGTNCAVPMEWALQHRVPVDVFTIYTDSETWFSPIIHPIQALREYRQKMGIPAKLIVNGMTSTGFTIGDPTDAGCLDVVGFDTATPSLMADFAVN